MRVYKLTDEYDQTYNATRWGEGVTHTASGEGELCGAGWLHAYRDPLLAVLLNPIHADFARPHLWEAEAAEPIRDDHGLKLGTTRLTTLRRIVPPVVTTEQRIRFAILCALEVCHDPAFRQWADSWLDGSDRSASAASAASAAADAAAAWAAWAAAAWAAADAAAAAWAAWAAAALVHRSLDLVSIAQAATNP